MYFRTTLSGIFILYELVFIPGVQKRGTVPADRCVEQGLVNEVFRKELVSGTVTIVENPRQAAVREFGFISL